MSDLETRFHETWLGLVQPTEGLVVSVPVLSDAMCAARQPAEVHERFLELTAGEGGERAITDLARFFEDVLQHPVGHFDRELPAELSLYVPEGQETLRPTMGLFADPATHAGRELPADAPEAVKASAPYVALVWEVPPHVDLDRPETVTGPWEHHVTAKLDRLLRHTQVPIGILTNRRAIRLLYAPHGESSGSITFRVDHMAAVDGRPILDALVMLLSAYRFYVAGEEKTLPALLTQSRKRQADVTNELAEQVLDAIQILLRGFEVAAERDGSTLLRDAVQREDDHVYGGLLTVLLRLVFVLYAEDWSLLPVESRVWSQHYSVLGLFEQLQRDHGAYPDSMGRRFGAWGRLVALFRAVYLGLDHTALRDGAPDAEASLHMPPRRGHLFDPERFPFLEGWPEAGGAPIKDPAARAAVRVPSVDDATVFAVLEKLVMYRPQGAEHGHRLSYKALDVEQLGSVYEGLMGYHVVPLDHDGVALKVKNKASAARAWVEVETLLAQPAGRRAAWLQAELGFDKASAKKAAEATKDADLAAATEALLDLAAGKSKARRPRYFAPAGRLVLQPGPERRRTSSHYTPRELSAPIVRRTLEPLLAVMGEAPPSARILNLKVCDPAMGSGAFLVEACRFLADEVVKAWTREKALPVGSEPTLVARRLVAQRCLYGVDKNAYAVDLAKLSLWLVTLAKELPFTFLDHSLRHGDSLVGLDFDQIRAGHWKVERGIAKKGAQLETAELTLREALDEAIAIRSEIVELASEASPAAQRLKEQKLGDADDALAHARLLADLVVGAFFAHEKDKAREQERKARIEAFAAWKASGEPAIPEELLAWQREIRGRLPVFHWMLELPEVFYAERPDPLDEDQRNRAAYMDAFVGNPPFAGKNGITEANGEGYVSWLMARHPEVQGHPNVDLCGYFLRRAGSLSGAHGALGMVATNTVAQGDTRLIALKHMIVEGWQLTDVRTGFAWPGDASVHVCLLNACVGNPTLIPRPRTLDGLIVDVIDSRLRAAREQPEAVPLSTNASMSFTGGKLIGEGLLLSGPEREALVAADPRNAGPTRPYLSGDEVNNNIGSTHDRYVIDFTGMTLEQASAYPMLLQIVSDRVRPDREKNNRQTYKTYWWRPGESAGALRAALGPQTKCMATAVVTKHLMFSFLRTDQFFSHKLYLFPLDQMTPFAVLQSRVHERWARLLSSTMEDRLNYSASDCFETFPFPERDPRAVIPALEDIGQRLYDARAAYMLDEQVGLTITYNRLKDPAVTDPRIVELRRLHEEMDAAVLAAYGWSDIPVPPFCAPEPAALEAFENAVIDRLFALNAERAEEERLLGASTAKGGKKKKAAKKPPKPKPSSQPNLFGEDEGN